MRLVALGPLLLAAACGGSTASDGTPSGTVTASTPIGDAGCEDKQLTAIPSIAAHAGTLNRAILGEPCSLTCACSVGQCFEFVSTDGVAGYCVTGNDQIFGALTCPAGTTSRYENIAPLTVYCAP